MPPRSTIVTGLVVGLVVLAVFMAVRIFRSGGMEYSPLPTTADSLVTFKTYKVRPSKTDGASNDCGECPGSPGPGIGCDSCWHRGQKTDKDGNRISTAPDDNHVLYVPVKTKNTGKLLVFLAGYPGNPDKDGLHDDYHWLYQVMVLQGYHVIGLSTFISGLNSDCQKTKPYQCPELEEIITGADVSTNEEMSKHSQDSLVTRLVAVLLWAAMNHPEDGWGRYLTGLPFSLSVDWTQVHLAGFSQGSTYASFMGSKLYPKVERVALFSGPNDGDGDSEEEWTTADYIQNVEGTGTRYYGLVHWYNKANTQHCGGVPVITEYLLYQVMEAWLKFGMGPPSNSEPFWFDPQLGVAPNFGDSHMLVSWDMGTSPGNAHVSVVRDEYKDCDDGFPVPENECKDENRIGYEAAWRYILGRGD